MRFIVHKDSDNEAFYRIWDKEQRRWYCFGGIQMRGTKEEMDKTAVDLNRLQMTKEKLKKKAEQER